MGAAGHGSLKSSHNQPGTCQRQASVPQEEAGLHATPFVRAMTTSEGGGADPARTPANDGRYAGGSEFG